MSFQVHPLTAQSNLLAHRGKESQNSAPPLIKLTTFGSTGSNRYGQERMLTSPQTNLLGLRRRDAEGEDSQMPLITFGSARSTKDALEGQLRSSPSRKDTESEERVLKKLTTFGSTGSNKDGQEGLLETPQSNLLSLTESVDRELKKLTTFGSIGLNKEEQEGLLETPQSNLLSVSPKDSEGKEPVLKKLSTFGSIGSSKDTPETVTALLGVTPEFNLSGFRCMSFGHEETQKAKVEEVKRKEGVVTFLQSQGTAAFPSEGPARSHERSQESESIFTLVTDPSEAEVEKSIEDKRLMEDSVQLKKSAIRRLATLEREDFDLVHRCCRRLQKGCFAEISVYKDSDKDWWVVRVTELLTKHKSEEVLEPGHSWTQNHSAFELASLIETDAESHLVLPVQRVDLFVPKESEENSESLNSSDRRKSAFFGPKRETIRTKMMGGMEYEIGIELKVHGSKTDVSVSASPKPGPGPLMTECFNQTDLKDASIAAETDIEKLADGLVARLQMSQGTLRLRPSISRRESVSSLIPEISGINYQTSRKLNNELEYQITFSSIPLVTGTDKTIYVDAQPLQEGGKLEKQLELDEDELRQIVDFPVGELLPEHLETIANFLIIESGTELHLGQRHVTGRRSVDAPTIVVSVDSVSERSAYSRIRYPQHISKDTERSRLQAAVRIQTLWRRVACRQRADMEKEKKTRLLAFRKGAWKPEAWIVSGFKTNTKTWIAAEAISKEDRMEKDCDSGFFPTAIEAVRFISGEISPEEDQLDKEKSAVVLSLQKMLRGKAGRTRAAEVRKSDQSRKPSLTKVQRHQDKDFIISLYESGSGLEIEAMPLQSEVHGQRFKTVVTREQMQNYGSPVDLEAVLRDVKVSAETVILERQVLLYTGKLSTSEGEYQVIVTVNAPDLASCRDRNLLRFEAVRDSVTLEAKASVQEVVNCLGEISSLSELARLAVSMLLEVNEGVLVVNTTNNMQEIAVKLQAAGRGFIERKNLKKKPNLKGRLVALSTKNFGEVKYTIYAYANENGITVEAMHKGKAPLSLDFSKTFLKTLPNSDQLKLLCEQSIFPQLSLSPEGKLQIAHDSTESSLFRRIRRPQLTVQSVATTSINSLPPSPIVGTPVHSRTLKRYDSEELSGSDDVFFEVKFPTPRLCTPTKPAERRIVRQPKTVKTHTRMKSEVTQAVTQRKSKQSDVMFIPVYEDAKPGELLLKLGMEISGVYLIVAVHRTEKGVTLDATQPKTKEKFQLEVKEEIPHSPREAELACHALIERLRLRKNKAGTLLQLRPAAPQVLYKRSHYISDRYMVLSVFDLGTSVELQALDPTTQKILRLSLGKMKYLNPEQLYRELCLLVKRLRVETVLGEEVLVLSQ